MTEMNSWLKEGARKLGAREYAEAQCLLTLALIDAVTAVGQEIQGLRRDVERVGRRNDVGMNVAQITEKLGEFNDKIDNHLKSVA